MILINWYVTMNNAPKNNQKTSWWDSLKGCTDESLFYDLWAQHGKTRLNLLKKWIFDAKKEDKESSVVPRLSEKAIKISELNFFLAARKASIIKKDVEEEVAGFARCEYYWRFVPVEQATAHHRCVCHVCREDLPWVQSRAAEIGRRDLNKAVAVFRDALRNVWPSSPLPAGWGECWYTSPENLSPKAPTEIDVHIHGVLPHVFCYVLRHGGDPCSPLDVLDILDPAAPDEPTAVKSRRAHIHRLLAGEFSMYRRELALAQVFLLYEDKHPRPQHGGARPGAGGHREGAGRPPKKMEEVKRGRGRPSTKKIFAA